MSKLSAFAAATFAGLVSLSAGANPTPPSTGNALGAFNNSVNLQDMERRLAEIRVHQQTVDLVSASVRSAPFVNAMEGLNNLQIGPYRRLQVQVSAMESTISLQLSEMHPGQTYPRPKEMLIIISARDIQTLEDGLMQACGFTPQQAAAELGQWLGKIAATNESRETIRLALAGLDAALPDVSSVPQPANRKAGNREPSCS